MISQCSVCKASITEAEIRTCSDCGLQFCMKCDIVEILYEEDFEEDLSVLIYFCSPNCYYQHIDGDLENSVNEN